MVCIIQGLSRKEIANSVWRWKQFNDGTTTKLWAWCRESLRNAEVPGNWEQGKLLALQSQKRRELSPDLHESNSHGGEVVFQHLWLQVKDGSSCQAGIAERDEGNSYSDLSQSLISCLKSPICCTPGKPGKAQGPVTWSSIESSPESSPWEEPVQDHKKCQHTWNLNVKEDKWMIKCADLTIRMGCFQSFDFFSCLVVAQSIFFQDAF